MHEFVTSWYYVERERERGENVSKGQNRKDESGVMWWRKGERDKKYFKIEVGSYHMGKREGEREM